MTSGTGGRGPQARSVPQGPAVSLWRGRRLWALLAAGRQLVFLSGPESDVRHWGPWPAGPVRPSGPCCFAVARAPFVGLVGGWKTACFFVGSESQVRHWGPWPAGPVRPSGPCCFAVARAPFVGLVGGWKTASFLVGSIFVTLGTGGRGPQARSVPQGSAVSLWRGRRLWALLAAGRQLVFL